MSKNTRGFLIAARFREWERKKKIIRNSQNYKTHLIETIGGAAMGTGMLIGMLMGMGMDMDMGICRGAPICV